MSFLLRMKRIIPNEHPSFASFPLAFNGNDGHKFLCACLASFLLP